MLKRGKLSAGRDCLRCDAQIEVDVSVHAGEKMLEDDRFPGGGQLKSDEPALAQRLSTAKAAECREIAIGECYIEFLHARAIFKRTGCNAFLHFHSYVAIKRGEKAETA